MMSLLIQMIDLLICYFYSETSFLNNKKLKYLMVPAFKILVLLF